MLRVFKLSVGRASCVGGSRAPPVGPARSHVRRRWREWQWQLFVPFRALVDAWRTEKGGLSAAAARCSLRGGPPRSASLFRAL